MPRLNNGTWELIYTGRKMIGKIVDFLYKDADTFLIRKYEIIKQLNK